MIAFLATTAIGLIAAVIAFAAGMAFLIHINRETTK